MANFDQLKQSVAALIRTNGAEEITGQIMQDVLLTIINSISGGYMFGGVAQHNGNVGNPDYNVFYLAGSGAYTGYGGAITIENGCYGVFRYNGSWTQEVVDIGVRLSGSVTAGETRGCTGDTINTALQTLFDNVMDILDTLTFTYNTPSAQQATKAMLDVIMTPTGGASHVFATLTLASATVAAAGLMSAEDKQKVDRMLTDFRSLSLTDTTAAVDQATKIVQTLSATLGENPEAITTMTFLAATASKAGLMSAADKAVLDCMVAMLGYYECSTAASTAAKVVSASGYSLTSGGCIRIKMNNANTADNVTLNINSTGVKALYYDGAQASSSNSWEAGEVLEVYYDGTQYQCASGGGGKFASGQKVKDVSLLDALDGSGNLPKSSAVVSYLSPLMVSGAAVDIQYNTVITGVQISNGKWITQSGRSLYIIPYSYTEGDNMRITGNAANSSYYAFLTSDDHTVGHNVPFAIVGQTEWTKVDAGITEDIPIPSNCTYIAINKSYQGSGLTDFLPSKLQLITRGLVNAQDMLDDIDELKDEVPQIAENANHIEQLGRRCVQQGETVQQTVYASIGIWQASTGEIATTSLIRAHLKLLVMGYDHLTVTIPQGYYAQFYYVNDDNISLGTVTGSLDWYVGTKELEINGEHDIMLNIKYGSAGNTDITQEMLANLGWETEKSVSAGYAPAAPYSAIEQLDNVLYGSQVEVPSSAFQQGTNNSDGDVVSSTIRLITTNLIAISSGNVIKIMANGQKYVILTYSTAGVYETTSGWMTEDGEYEFQTDKKVRFLAAKLDNSTIVVSELAVDYVIIASKGLIEEVEKMKDGSGSAVTKGNDSFNMFNKRVVLYNPYKDKPSNVFKGQMHCHTTNSDGADSPTTVVQKYLAAGYDFIAITDHNYITPDPQVQGIVYLANSYEDTHNSAGYQHMCVWNAQEVLNYVSMYQTTNTPATIVAHFVKNGNSVVSYNHPEYPAVYASDAELESLPKGISIVEIFNGTIQTLLGTVAAVADLPTEAYYGDMYDCTGNGKRYINTSTTYASPTWTETTAQAKPDGNLDRGFRIMLDKGHKVFCNAVDDYHRGDNMFNRGWMMVYANSKTKESIWNALLNGCSYASAGVVLTDVNVKDGLISLQIENGESAVTTFYGENNTVLATVTGSSASYQIQGTEKYVRAMVQIGRFKAWTQPVWVIDVVNQYGF